MNMQLIHPIARLMSALGFIAAIFMAGSLGALGVIYGLILVGLLTTSCIVPHIRLVLLATTPLLLALVVIWGLVLPPEQIPTDHHNGFTYAFFSWLRVAASSGVLQVLLLPLIRQPLQLKNFLERNGLPNWIGVLVLATVIFIPEVQRRMGQVIDARRAQGFALRGLAGLRALPEMLMPLVTSLLVSASNRAELWNHRGIFQRPRQPGSPYAHGKWQSATALLVSASAVTVGVFL